MGYPKPETLNARLVLNERIVAHGIHREINDFLDVDSSIIG
jgi:hypothetical protein